MYRFLTVCILSIFLLGCDQQPSQKHVTGSPITFELNNDRQNIHSTGLIKDVDVMALDNDVLIGEIDEIIRYNHYLYLLDRENHTVSIYDTSGNFINNISDYGRAGDQYNQLTDILVDNDDETLKLISRVDRKLISYSLNGSDLLKTEKLPKSFFKLSKNDGGFFGFVGNYIDGPDSKNIWAMKGDLTLKKGFFDIDKSFDSYISSSIIPFSEYNGDLYFTKMMDYNIYSLNDREPNIEWTFDFGESNWPETVNTLAKMDAMSHAEKSKYIREIEAFQETDNFLILELLYQGQSLLGVYNKENKQGNIATLEPYADKYFFSFGRLIGMDENAIYTMVDAVTMKRYIDGKDAYNNFEELYPQQIERLRNRFSDLEIDVSSNPFLITYYLN